METRSLADFYRPKKFSDVIGQSEIVNCIRGMFKSKKIPPVILLSGPTGTGKAQPLSANILTPFGFKKMADVKTGDTVVSSIGLPIVVKGVYPQGLKKIYKVSFSDGTFTHCCEDHLWQVQTPLERKKESWKVLSLKEIMKDSLYIKRSDGYKRWKYYIPIAKPIQFDYEAKKADLIISDDNYKLLENYTGDIARTLGKWLVYDEIDSIANIHILQQCFPCINLNKDNKYIPNYFLFNSVHIRWEVLKGIIGFSEFNNGKVKIIKVNSDRLAQDIAFLIRSLNGIAKVDGNIIKAVIPTATGRDNKYLYKQIRNIEPDGEEYCQCIQVDSEDGLYITDDFIVTHNTTVARLLAKYINCDTNNNCGKCRNCTYFENGNHPDVSEINFADSRGIDDVRQYIKEATIMPSIGNKRIFIVDECHMLTPQAAQCLLKPLEDVPPNTVWLLVTMNPEKLNKAIVGRCFHLPFRMIEKDQLKDRLLKIFSAEIGKDADEIQENAIDMIADISCGQVRFSLQLLESFIYRVKSGIKLTKENVLNYLNTSSEFELDESAARLVVGYLKNNPADIIKYCKSSNIRGVLYKMRFLIHYLLQNSVGIAQFRPYSAAIITKECKKLDYAALNDLQNRLITIETAMNTTSIDESILFQTKLLSSE